LPTFVFVIVASTADFTPTSLSNWELIVFLMLKASIFWVVSFAISINCRFRIWFVFSALVETIGTTGVILGVCFTPFFAISA
jgi:hypothetical protein